VFAESALVLRAIQARLDAALQQARRQARTERFCLGVPPIKAPQMELGADLKHNSLAAIALASQP
jgi:hypothetical protein